MSTDIKIWIGAICTIAIYSFLYRENKFYRFFEHVFMGVSAGYWFFRTWTDVLKPLWWDPMVEQKHWYWIFAAVVGLLWYFLYSKKYVWLSRVVIGFMLGAGAGFGIVGIFREYTPQIYASFVPVWPLVTFGPISFNTTNLTNLVCVVTLLSVITYFFFSIEHKYKPVRWGANLGRLLMMIAFGAVFGSTFMARISLFIGRILFLLEDWLKVIH